MPTSSDKDRWSRDHDKCVSCETNKIPHQARGLCTKCYNKALYEETRSDPEKLAALQARWREQQKANPVPTDRKSEQNRRHYHKKGKK